MVPCKQCFGELPLPPRIRRTTKYALPNMFISGAAVPREEYSQPNNRPLPARVRRAAGLRDYR
jgi:hypothetical protein